MSVGVENQPVALLGDGAEAPPRSPSCYKSACPLYSDPENDTVQRFIYNWLRGATSCGFASLDDLVENGTWDELKMSLAFTGMRYEGTKLAKDLLRYLSDLQEGGGLKTSEWTAVEAGPGAADQLYFFTEQFKKLVGVEFDETVYKVAASIKDKLSQSRHGAKAVGNVELVCDDICHYMKENNDVQLLLMSMTMCHIPMDQKWSLIDTIGKSGVQIFVLSCIFKGAGFDGESTFAGIELATVAEHLQHLDKAGFVLVRMSKEEGWRDFVRKRYEAFMKDHVKEEFVKAVSASAYESQLGFFCTVHKAFGRGMEGSTLILMRKQLASQLGVPSVELDRQ
mmetsp:Transcript_34333/g.97265  ORF Transcript_34333/g.97265 Transcript_34333/m.97265 type:complete len:338 (+) Transcript_34333:249-1262(+)